MRFGLALLAVGVLALVLQSGLSLHLPAAWVPDLGLLLVMAVALRVRSPWVGVPLAAALGACADLLSGSLLGQHTLLRLAVYGVARGVAARLNLRGALAAALLAACLTLLDALGLWALSAFFGAGLPGPVPAPRLLGSQILVNALLAPAVLRLAWALSARFSDDEGPNRPVRLEARAFPR